MRKFITLFFLSIVLIVCCKEYGGDNRSEIGIVHSWIHDTGDITLTFSEEGEYTYIYDDGDSQYQECGTYSTSDNFLNAMDSDGYSYTETFEVDGSILTLRDEDGYSHSFSRLSLM